VAAFFLTIVFISHEKWMGIRDIKLAFLMDPVLVTGTLLAMFFGQKLIDTYLNLFLLK